MYIGAMWRKKLLTEPKNVLTFWIDSLSAANQQLCLLICCNCSRLSGSAARDSGREHILQDITCKIRSGGVAGGMSWRLGWVGEEKCNQMPPNEMFVYHFGSAIARHACIRHTHKRYPRHPPNLKISWMEYLPHLAGRTQQTLWYVCSYF